MFDTPVAGESISAATFTQDVERNVRALRGMAPVSTARPRSRGRAVLTGADHIFERYARPEPDEPIDIGYAARMLRSGQSIELGPIDFAAHAETSLHELDAGRVHLAPPADVSGRDEPLTSSEGPSVPDAPAADAGCD